MLTYRYGGRGWQNLTIPNRQIIINLYKKLNFKVPIEKSTIGHNSLNYSYFRIQIGKLAEYDTGYFKKDPISTHCRYPAMQRNLRRVL